MQVPEKYPIEVKNATVKNANAVKTTDVPNQCFLPILQIPEKYPIEVKT